MVKMKIVLNSTMEEIHTVCQFLNKESSYKPFIAEISVLDNIIVAEYYQNKLFNVIEMLDVLADEILSVNPLGGKITDVSVTHAVFEYDSVREKSPAYVIESIPREN